MPGRRLYFFVGTTAELIKVLPVLDRLRQQRTPFTVIASGQNSLVGSELWPLAGLQGPDIVLWDRPVRQSAFGLASWLCRMFWIAGRRLRSEFARATREDTYFVVHGDTVSTLLGAVIARRFGLTLCHIEAGLRSFNWFRPFPEEICRVIVSHLADVAFCPNEWAISNLERHGRLRKINTSGNTLLDSLQMATSSGRESGLVRELPESFFVFVVHRQENLLNVPLVTELVDKVIEQSRRMPCLLILHRPAEVVFRKTALLERLAAAPGVKLVPRLPYIDFMHVLSRCTFIVTDGGSNQEEAFYMGKPCLLLRKETERLEGLGSNAVLSQCDPGVIDRFFNEYERHRQPPLTTPIRPSQVIVEHLAPRGR